MQRFDCAIHLSLSASEKVSNLKAVVKLRELLVSHSLLAGHAVNCVTNKHSKM